MDLQTFTFFHVALSLLGIASGLVMLLFGFLQNRVLRISILIFLVTTILTSVTGFAFPNSHVTPGIILGILSVITLAIASTAMYVGKLAGRWRTTFVISSLVSLYFNMFVLVAQSFEHVPALHSLAPTGSGPVFGVAQLILLAATIWLTVRAVKRFRS
jgi:hypothetical protein